MSATEAHRERKTGGGPPQRLDLRSEDASFAAGARRRPSAPCRKDDARGSAPGTLRRKRAASHLGVHRMTTRTDYLSAGCRGAALALARPGGGGLAGGRNGAQVGDHSVACAARKPGATEPVWASVALLAGQTSRVCPPIFGAVLPGFCSFVWVSTPG